ncbi:hypothetical protein TSUD_407890 [Trifolium subterraneum]|uniref:F-box domain-containing protein n=1 Tax=Trifolium subterraneum TaxID=3900 RepID=A0A2Z6PHJ0_TRISU|nr:hypothetical protein TSUD_407890 [Trifolium subterraneum]
MSDSSCEIIIPRPAKKKVNPSESENKDRFSNLSECVILHIMSFLNAKDAVRTCVLSTRWKDLWKHIPTLILHSRDFRSVKIFTEFVSKILSVRNSYIELQSLDFKYDLCHLVWDFKDYPDYPHHLEPHVLEKIVNYAISHHVQRLGLSVTSGIAQILPSLYHTQTLTHLKLSIYNSGIDREQISFDLTALRCPENLFPKYFNLPSLTSLQLGNFTFCVGDNDCAEPFSIFKRLNSLVISDCIVKGTETLCISSATLVNLTVYNNLKQYYKIELCTPNICTFTFGGTPYQTISGSDISSLKHVDLHAEVVPYSRAPPLLLFCWLLEFANIKSLTVTATTLQVLSLIRGLLKFCIHSLGNLKLLRVEIDKIQYGFRSTLCDVKLQNVQSKKEAARIQKAFELELEPSPPVPDGIVAFLLQNSPSAEVDFVDCTKKPLRPRQL